ncbi:MAG: hypothetical protein ABL876_17465 [Chitinophagaceae bacterium]
MYRKLLVFTSLLFTAFIVTAQNYVTLHENCGYGGKSYFLEPGTYRGYQMKIGNDKLSSIQIPYGFKVTIYENDAFMGNSKTYTANTSCLEAGWNDMASSIVVENNYNQGGYSQNDYVTFYNDTYSKGYSQSLRPGSYSGAQLGSLKYNISSFKINGNLRVKLYINNESYSGYAVTYDASQNSLPDNQNDKTGSLVIEYNTGLPNNNGDNGGGYASTSFATLYTDCNYGGNALRLMPGYYSGDKLGLLKYSIASIQVPSNLRVKAFINNDNLYGQSSTISENISCLDYNLKNKIGSVVVEERNGYYGGGGGQNPYGNETVIIYTDGNYKGQSAALLPGTYSTMSQASGFPDKALSSLKVPPGYRVVLYEYVNFGGKSYTITESKSGFIISGWNDKASSIKVYRD